MTQKIQKSTATFESANECQTPAFTFTSDGKAVFKVYADGKIEKGEAFTTEDAASLRFWEIIAENFRSHTGLDFWFASSTRKLP